MYHPQHLVRRAMKNNLMALLVGALGAGLILLMFAVAYWVQGLFTL